MINCLVNHPTNHITMVKPFAATAAWMWWISPPPTPGSLFRRGWPRVVYEGFVKFNDAAKKKIISINNGFILVLLFDWSLSPPIQWHYISQAIIPVDHPLLCHLLQARLFLVGCCVYPHQSVAVSGLGVIHFTLFFCCLNRHPSHGTTSPHMLQPPHTLSPTSLLPLSSISGWLLCVFIKFWP